MSEPQIFQEYVVLDDEDTFSPLSKNTTVVCFTRDDLNKSVEDDEDLIEITKKTDITVEELLNSGCMKNCIEHCTQELRIDRLVDLYRGCQLIMETLPKEIQTLVQKVNGCKND